MRFSVIIVLACVASHSAMADTPVAPASFTACQMCHDASRGGAALIGPPLWGIGGRKAGSSPGFAYSPAMTRYATRWQRDTLAAFIMAPQKVVVGTKMAFGGVTTPADAEQIADYLLTLR